MNLVSHLRQNAVFILTLVGIVAGIIAGILAHPYNIKPGSVAFRLINFPGEIFLRGIRLLILPILSSSLISAMAGQGATNGSAIIRRTLNWFFISSLLASLLAFSLTWFIKSSPANNDNSNSTLLATSLVPKLSPLDTALDVFRNLIPDNFVEMGFQMYRSKIEPIETALLKENKSQEFKVSPGHAKGINVLGLAVFSGIFGALLGKLGDKGLVMRQFFEALSEISINMIKLFMWFSPLGVCSLVCVSIIQMQDPVFILKMLANFILVIFLGDMIQTFLVLPLLFVLITRKNIFKFTLQMVQVFLVAFATASSSATLQTSIECIENKAGYPKAVSRVVLPSGIIMNKDGTVIFYVLSTVLMAQLNQVELSLVDMILLVIVAMAISIGGGGIPGAHLVNLLLILSLYEIPAEKISLLYAVDWLVDRFMTPVNCWSDCVVCAIVTHLSRDELSQDAEEESDSFESQDLISSSNKIRL